MSCTIVSRTPSSYSNKSYSNGMYSNNAVSYDFIIDNYALESIKTLLLGEVLLIGVAVSAK